MDALRQLLRSQGHVTVTVLLFDDYELLDVFGPLELLAGAAYLPSARGKLKLRFLSASATREAQPAGGPVTLTDACIHDDLSREEVDVLFVPGGLGTRSLQDDAAYIAKLTELAERAKVVLTVCTGSMLLAKTKLLDGQVATTNKRAFQQIQAQYPGVQWQASARWSVCGKFFTSSGISAGTDLAHHFLAELLGSEVAKEATKAAEYVPGKDPERDPFAGFAHDKPAEVELVNKQGKTLKVLCVVYDQFEMLDTFGPLEMFSLANRVLAPGQPPALEVTTVAEEREVQCFGGPRFRADKLCADVDAAKQQYDLVLLPGGVGTLREVHNPAMHSWLPPVVGKCTEVMTVCTGSAILASMGLLDGLRATTNKLTFDLMSLFGGNVRWVADARWVSDGKFHTSSGVSAGTDLSLALLRKLFGAGLAAAVAARAEYSWNPEDDGKRDPFTKSIPRATWSRFLFTRTANLLLRVVFALGFLLGLRMKITKALV